MRQFIRWLSKFAIVIAVLIALEALFTMGVAFKFEMYTTVAWIFQLSIIIIGLYVSLLDWETGEYWPQK